MTETKNSVDRKEHERDICHPGKKFIIYGIWVLQEKNREKRSRSQFD